MKITYEYFMNNINFAYFEHSVMLNRNTIDLMSDSKENSIIQLIYECNTLSFRIILITSNGKKTAYRKTLFEAFKEYKKFAEKYL